MTDMTPEQALKNIEFALKHEADAKGSGIKINADEAFKIVRAALSANGGEAIYQIKLPGDVSSAWHDASEDAYHVTSEGSRRIVYTHPAPPPVAQNVEWFFYDAENGHIELCETKEESLSKAQKAVDFCFDECWSDDVEYICVGTITHRAKQTDLMFKPQKLDEDMFSEDGEHWPKDCESKCDYSIEPIDPQPQGGEK